MHNKTSLELSAVEIDLHRHRVIGWGLSVNADAELLVRALDMTYQQREKPCGVLFKH